MADSLELVEGVVGGFVPAVVRLKIHIQEENGQVKLNLKRLTKKTFHPTDGDYVTQSGEIPKDEWENLKQFVGQIFNLPIEDPIGSEDVYQLDTRFIVNLNGKCWTNEVPEGCVHQVPDESKLPSKEQKEQFASMAQAVKKLSEQYAK